MCGIRSYRNSQRFSMDATHSTSHTCAKAIEFPLKFVRTFRSWIRGLSLLLVTTHFYYYHGNNKQIATRINLYYEKIYRVLLVFFCFCIVRFFPFVARLSSLCLVTHYTLLNEWRKSTTVPPSPFISYQTNSLRANRLVTTRLNQIHLTSMESGSHQFHCLRCVDGTLRRAKR